MNPASNFETNQPNAPQSPNTEVTPPATVPEGVDPNAGIRHPLEPLVKAWLLKISAAYDYKKRVFSDAAQEIMYFYRGGKELNQWLWGNVGRGRGGYLQQIRGDNEDELAPPHFRYTMNKVAEVCQLFLPALYSNNPVRTVSPRNLKPIPPEIYQILAGPPPQPPPQLAAIAQANPNMVPQLEMIVQQIQQAYVQQIMQRVQQQQQNDAQRLVIEQVRADLIEDYLNWTPNELDLQTESNRVIRETLIKGHGFWWTELYVQRGFGTKLVGSFYVSADYVLFDPDVQLRNDCTWVCRIRHTPQWDLEDFWGLARGALNGAGMVTENVAMTSEMATDPEAVDGRQRATTNKIITTYEIWSKMGLGGRMAGIEPKLRDTFDGFGDYCHLVLVNGVPYPLNLPSQLVNKAPQEFDPQATTAWANEMRKAVEWPTPVWAFSDGWPFTDLVFHEIPNQTWGMSHFLTGLGELKWINWAMSWLAAKVKNACGTIVAVAKSVQDEEKRKLINPGDQRVVEVDLESGPGGAGDVTKMVAYLQQPQFHPDIYNMVDRTAQILDKRWGVSPQLYGMTGAEAGSTQDRSATETQLKQQNLSIRLKDMADKVQYAMTILARKEAFLARWFLTANDVAPALGQDRAQLWQQLVQSAEVEAVVRELDYRIESGSMQILDRQAKIQNLNNLMQSQMPFLEKIAMEWQQVNPYNALMEDWGKLNQTDVSRYMIQPPPPPPQPMPPPEAGKPPEQGPPQNGPPPEGQHGTEEPPRQAA